MVAGPTADEPSTPLDAGSDEFFAAAPERDESEFWSEADGAKGGASRARRRAPADRPRGLRQRLGAAWAAESSARRALRGRSTGADETGRRRRRMAAGVVGGVALLAAALAVGESIVNDGTSSDRAGAEESALETGTGPSTDGVGGATAGGDGFVEPAVVDPPAGTRTKPASRPKAATTTTAPKATTTAPAGSPAAGSGSPSIGGSGGSGGAAPAPPVPTTAPAPPATAPPATPTTAPRPAVPTVQSFTATPASSAGGVCPPLQWATTFTWSTTHATTVTITGLLEATQSGLPGDGSRVVCRLLPTGPVGGWTLTATGPGGSATASAG